MSGLSFGSSDSDKSGDETPGSHREWHNIRSSTYDSVQVVFGDEAIDIDDALSQDSDDWNNEPSENHIRLSDITCDTHIDECTQKALLKRVTPFSEFKQAHEDFRNAPTLDQLLALTKADIECARKATLLGILHKADFATKSDLDHKRLLERTMLLREDEKHGRRQQALALKYCSPRHLPKEILEEPALIAF